MGKEKYIVEEKKGLLLAPNGLWYSPCAFHHLLEQTINGKTTLMEYYQRMSAPTENDLLCGYTVWIYGDDRPQNPPHCHLILGDPKSAEYNIEVHLLDLEAYHLEAPIIKNITWSDISKKVKDGFFKWLLAPHKHYGNNIQYLLEAWNSNNSQKTINQWAEEYGIEKLHPLVKDFIIGKQIDISDIIKSIFEIVLPLYKKDSEAKEKLHKITNPIRFAQEVGLPFEFTEYNSTQKIKNIIQEYEKMCYEISNSK